MVAVLDAGRGSSRHEHRHWPSLGCVWLALYIPRIARVLRTLGVFFFFSVYLQGAVVGFQLVLAEGLNGV